MAGLEGIITLLQNTIFLISTALLVPVMALLVAGVGISLFELGRFLYEFVVRRRHPSRIEEIAWSLDTLSTLSTLRTLGTPSTSSTSSTTSTDAAGTTNAAGTADTESTADKADAAGRERISDALKVVRMKGSSWLVQSFIDELERMSAKIQDARVLKVQVEKLIQNYEEKAEKRNEMTRILVRVGPMLGLMGTLIPMGPALIALSQGDLETLANNLIIAFGTTVLGLLIGGVSYMITEVRNRWYDRDLSDIAYISEILFGD